MARQFVAWRRLSWGWLLGGLWLLHRFICGLVKQRCGGCLFSCGTHSTGYLALCIRRRSRTNLPVLPHRSRKFFSLLLLFFNNWISDRFPIWRCWFANGSRLLYRITLLDTFCSFCFYTALCFRSYPFTWGRLNFGRFLDRWDLFHDFFARNPIMRINRAS